MTQHQNKTRLRARRAVLTRAACARRGLRRETALVDVVAVGTVFVAIFVAIFL